MPGGELAASADTVGSPPTRERAIAADRAVRDGLAHGGWRPTADAVLAVALADASARCRAIAPVLRGEDERSTNPVTWPDRWGRRDMRDVTEWLAPYAQSCVGGHLPADVVRDAADGAVRVTDVLPSEAIARLEHILEAAAEQQR